MRYKVIIRRQVKKEVEKQQKYIIKAFYNWIEEKLPNNPHKENDGLKRD